MPLRGQRVGSMVRLKQDLKKASGEGFIRGLKDGETAVVYFPMGPEDWFGYYEHWVDNGVSKGFVPCYGDDCKACNLDPDGRVSQRFLAPVWFLGEDGTTKGELTPMRLPKDLAKRVTIQYDRFGSLDGREFALYREGSGLDTTYDVSVHDKATHKVPSDRLKEYDAIAILEGAYERFFAGDDDEDDAEPTRPAQAASARRPARGHDEEPPAAESDEDETDEYGDDEPVTRAELEELTTQQLKEIAAENDIDLPTGIRGRAAKKAYVDAILKAMEELEAEEEAS